MKFSESTRTLSCHLGKAARRFSQSVFLLACATLLFVFILLFECDSPHAQYLWGALWLSALIGVVGSVYCEVREGMGKARGDILWRAVLPLVFLAGGYGAFLIFEQWHVLLAYAGILTAAYLTALYLLTRGEENLRAAFEVTRAVFLAMTVGIVLMIGIHLCFGAFTELLFDSQDSLRFLFCSYGLVLFFAALVFLSAIPQPAVSGGERGAQTAANEPAPVPTVSKRGGRSGVLRAVLVYAVLPLYLLLLVVLFLYFLKIVITLTLPEGGLNIYACLAEVFYLFCLFSVSAFAGEVFYVRFFRRYGGLFMLPVLAMQGVAIGVRIGEYGLTAPRLCTLSLMAVTLAFVLGSFFRTVGVGKAMLFSTALILVFTATPLNLIDLPIYQQTAALKSVLTRNGMLSPQGVLTPNPDLAEHDRRVICRTYGYLMQFPERCPVWLENVSYADFNKTFGFAYAQERNIPETLFCRYDNHFLEENGLDVSTYRFLCENSSAAGVFGYDDPFDGTAHSYDSGELLVSLMQRYGTGYTTVSEGPVDLGDGTAFFFTDICFSYDQAKDEYRNIQIRGYFLLES